MFIYFILKHLTLWVSIEIYIGSTCPKFQLGPSEVHLTLFAISEVLPGHVAEESFTAEEAWFTCVLL